MDLIPDLMAVGFTEYESKVYLALLNQHVATGYQLSKEAGIPRSMVYEALGRLRNRGAVLESQEDKVTLYRPVPPDALLDAHALEQERIVSTLRAGLAQLYTAQTDERQWTIEGRTPIFQYAEQMIADAKHEVKCVLGDPELELLRTALLNAAGRGLAIRALLTGTGQLEVGEVARHPPLESKLQQITNSALVIADDQEVLIATLGRTTTATITRNHSMVFVAGQFVWMELFTQRIYARLGSDLLARLEPDDRAIFESLR